MCSFTSDTHLIVATWFGLIVYLSACLNYQTHWENHWGSQSTNRERQIKVGSILNILTNINEELSVKMNKTKINMQQNDDAMGII